MYTGELKPAIFTHFEPPWPWPWPWPWTSSHLITHRPILNVVQIRKIFVDGRTDIETEFIGGQLGGIELIK